MQPIRAADIKGANVSKFFWVQLLLKSGSAEILYLFSLQNTIWEKKWNSTNGKMQCGCS